MFNWNDGTELYHHGIKGQRWGINNGPPYPLNTKDHNRVVSGKQKKLRISNKEYKDSRKRQLKKDEKAGSYHYLNTNTTTFMDSSGNITNQIKWKDYQNRELIDASDLSEPTNVAELIDQNESFRKVWSKGMNLEKLQHCNPGFGETGTTNNCMKNTANMEMMFRGYDTSAGRSLGGGNNAAMQYWFDGARPYKESSLESAVDRISSFGNQGRGEINVRYADGSGHSIYFCNEWNGDKGFTVLDGQCSDGFHGSSALESYCNKYGIDASKGFTITRLDDATPNFKHMAEDNVLRMNYTNSNMNAVENPVFGYQRGKYL